MFEAVMVVVFTTWTVCIVYAGMSIRRNDRIIKELDKQLTELEARLEALDETR